MRKIKYLAGVFLKKIGIAGAAVAGSVMAGKFMKPFKLDDMEDRTEEKEEARKGTEKTVVHNKSMQEREQAGKESKYGSYKTLDEYLDAYPELEEYPENKEELEEAQEYYNNLKK